MNRLHRRLPGAGSAKASDGGTIGSARNPVKSYPSDGNRLKLHMDSKPGATFQMAFGALRIRF